MLKPARRIHGVRRASADPRSNSAKKRTKYKNKEARHVGKAYEVPWRGIPGASPEALSRWVLYWITYRDDA